MSNQTHQSVRVLASDVAADLEVELVDLTLSGRGRRTMLKVVIDKEGGVTLGDCETFSRRLEALLDVEDPIQGPYNLEVSSPGLDRPLRSLGDFEKHVGKLIRVTTREKIDNQTFFIGRLLGLRDDVITLLTAEVSKEVSIPFADISKANLEIELK